MLNRRALCLLLSFVSCQRLHGRFLTFPALCADGSQCDRSPLCPLLSRKRVAAVISPPVDVFVQWIYYIQKNSTARKNDYSAYFPIFNVEYKNLRLFFRQCRRNIWRSTHLQCRKLTSVNTCYILQITNLYKAIETGDIYLSVSYIFLYVKTRQEWSNEARVKWIDRVIMKFRWEPKGERRLPNVYRRAASSAVVKFAFNTAGH